MGYQVCQDVRFSGRVSYMSRGFPNTSEEAFVESVCGDVSPTTVDAYTSFNENIESRISNCSTNSLYWGFHCKSVERIGQPELRTLNVGMNFWDAVADAVVAGVRNCLQS